MKCVGIGQKISAAFRAEGGTSCAGLSRFVRIIRWPSRKAKAAPNKALISCLVSSTPGQRSLPLSPSAAPFGRGHLRERLWQTADKDKYKQTRKVPTRLLRCGFARATKRA